MIVLITGQQGSGKTLYSIKEILSNHKKGKRVISNVFLKGIPYEEIDYKKVVNCEYDNAVIFIDEMHQLLPARRSLSKRSVEICDGFLSMIRKKKVILIGTTQLERKVDIRVREEMDYLISCTRYAYNKHTNSFEKVPPDFHSPTAICIIEGEAHCIFNNQTQKTFVMANKYYKFYDTSQIILINKKMDAESDDI